MKARGLTLVELLVVIAIIGTLAALLFPVFSGARHRGTAAVALAHLRQLSQAAAIYESSNDGLPPYEDLTAGYWLRRLGMMHGTKATLSDPAFRAPDPRSNLVTLAGYAINGCLGPSPVLTEPARTVQFATVGEFAEIHVEGISELNVVALAAPDSIEFGELGKREWAREGRTLVVRQAYGAERHSGRGAYVFADGHAKLHRADEFAYPVGSYLCGSPKMRLSNQGRGPTFLTDPSAQSPALERP